MDDLFNELSDAMRDLTTKAYQSFIFKLNENSNDAAEYLYNHALLDEEIYGKINIWVENLKKWFLDKIDQSDIGLNLQTKSCLKAQASTSSDDFLADIFESTTKSFFGDVLSSIEDFFSNLKDRIERLIFNVVSLVQTEVKKIDLKVHGIEQYQIVLSDNTNACDRCEEMDGQIFNADELKVGDTAPPFHPNCGCTMIPYVESEEEEENDDQATEYVDASQLEHIGFNNVTDSMVEELNEILAKYNITTKEQISHFLSQCFVESWHGNGLIEIDWARDNYAHIIGGPDYRGAGAIHISHKYTYDDFFKYIGVDINEIGVAPYIYVDENYYWESAGWYWSIFKDINSKINSSTTVEV